MRTISFRWLLRQPTTWMMLRHQPMRQLSIFMGAVFLLFSVSGFYTDLMQGGVQPVAVVLAVAAYNGLAAAVWVLIFARLPVYCVFLMIAAEIWLPLTRFVTGLAQAAFHQPPMVSEAGTATPGRISGPSLDSQPASRPAIVAAKRCRSSWVT